MFCGFGLFPLLTLSTCSHSHEHVQKEQVSKPTALEILKQRYARGEISREEFQQIRKELDR